MSLRLSVSESWCWRDVTAPKQALVCEAQGWGPGRASQPASLGSPSPRVPQGQPKKAGAQQFLSFSFFCMVACDLRCQCTFPVGIWSVCQSMGHFVVADPPIPTSGAGVRSPARLWCCCCCSGKGVGTRAPPAPWTNSMPCRPWTVSDTPTTCARATAASRPSCRHGVPGWVPQPLSSR